MNEFMKSLDDFTICLGEYNNDKMNMLFWLQTLIKKVKGKVYIIDFSKENTKEFIQECREKWEVNNFIDKNSFDKKVVVEDKIVCSMDFIYKYLEGISKNDYILLIGGEKLVPYSESKKIINTKYEGLSINASLMKDQDWKSFCLWIDKLYNDFQQKVQGIIVNIGVDNDTKTVILSLLNKSNNMSIICSETVEDKNNINLIIKEFYNKITNSNYDELIEFIENNKNNIDNKTYVVMLSQVYVYFGLSTKAIELLNQNYSSLSNNSKKLLADLLYREGKNETKCKKILDEIFVEDKFLLDLMPSILRVYSKDTDEIRKKWITIALEVDPENPKVIEYYGNWLSHNKEYKEASIVFRKLRDILHNQYYEIVARINDILFNPPKNPLDIQRYVLQAVQNYPQLHNEAILRLVTYFTEINKSEYITYSLLNDIDYNYDEELIYKLLTIKLDILSDIVSASKALGKLKPYNKKDHAKKINIERIKCITNSIMTIAKQPRGYLEWRRFIDNCQSEDGWSEVVYRELIECIEHLNSIDLNKLVNNSFMKKVEGCNDEEKGYLGIKLLRRIKTGDFNEKNIYDVIIGLLKYAEIEHDEDIKIWGRYYASIIYSLRGNDQMANDYALSIMDYYDIVSEEKKAICILLGVMAWANSQFRIGRKIEGIICVMSCIKYIAKAKEVYPILEEGLNIIGRFFSDDMSFINSYDKDNISKILQSLSIYNDSLIVPSSFMSNSLEEIEHKLEKKISSYQEKDIEWAGDITNLVAIYIKKSEEPKAINLIKDNYKKIIELFNFRMDLRYKLAGNWAEFLFLRTHPSIETYLIAKELLEIAIKDVENKRNVYHKEERAVIGDESKKIYKMYIELTGIMFKARDMKLISRNEYFEILENNLIKICPRSIIEQKEYNKEKIIDESLITKENEFLKLKEEYNILYNKNQGVSDELNNLALRMEELQKYLRLNHPYYMPLPKVEKISFKEIQDSLTDKEIFFQCIKLNISSIQIIITSKEIIIDHQLLSVNEIDNSLNKINEYIYKNNISKDDISINKYIERISKYFGSQVLRYCMNNKVDKIYAMSDLSLGTYNLNMCQLNGIYLLDRIKSIVNILDYNIFKNKKESSKCDKFVNRIFGNDNDKNLKLINDFLKKNEKDNFIIVENNGDEVETLIKSVRNNNVDTLLLYGHGVNDPNGSKFSGSLGIQGKRELIHVENILEQQNNIKNIIIISCRGGVPINNNIESSTGCWAELFERFNGNIILCKWDVDTESSILILEKMLNYIEDNQELEQALISAIMELKVEYKNPAYWSGIELWMN